jgi:hypothetical protein
VTAVVALAQLNARAIENIGALLKASWASVDGDQDIGIDPCVYGLNTQPTFKLDLT